MSEDVWDFQVGGYQVCHKWLKDRKGRTLSDDDIIHYKKIVEALKLTIAGMAVIDEVIDNSGGWPGEFQGATATADDAPVRLVAEPSSRYEGARTTRESE